MRNAQNIQILPTNSDSSIDNESIKEVEIAYFTKNLGVSTIIYLTVPMECPATSPDGVATVFSIQGWKNHMNTFNDIQYSIGSGDFESDIFKQINKNNNENNEENYTYITFLSAQDSQCKFKQNGITCSGRPKLIRLLEKEFYKYRCIIGCTNYKP
ncbi:unnamed protein product [Rhizophagus irregularis]|nr:unnamed protein product [Rhizophagus irregularis]